jgi:hypothetical protein
VQPVSRENTAAGQNRSVGSGCCNCQPTVITDNKASNVITQQQMNGQNICLIELNSLDSDSLPCSY